MAGRRTRVEEMEVPDKVIKNRNNAELKIFVRYDEIEFRANIDNGGDVFIIPRQKLKELIQ